ncbi:hypothetical protein SprV_0802567500 [Sparganum proliferum]
MIASHLVDTLLLVLTVSACFRSSPDLNPSDLSVQVLSPTSVNLSWKPPTGTTNGTPVYNVRLGSKFRAMTNATTINISGLLPSTEYKFRVLTMVGKSSFVMPGIYATARTADVDPNKAFSAGYPLRLSFSVVGFSVISYW